MKYRVIRRGAAPTNQEAPLLTVTNRQEITTARMGSQGHAVIHSIQCSAPGVACPLQKSEAACATPPAWLLRLILRPRRLWRATAPQRIRQEKRHYAARQGKPRSSGSKPRKIVTDKLRSYGVAHRELMPDVIHNTARYTNNRAE